MKELQWTSCSSASSVFSSPPPGGSCGRATRCPREETAHELALLRKRRRRGAAAGVSARGVTQAGEVLVIWQSLLPVDLPIAAPARPVDPRKPPSQRETRAVGRPDPDPS